MDISSLINAQSLATKRLTDNPLNLKVGQQLDVKVTAADIQAAKNAIILTLGDKDITVQSNQPVKITPGQDLKIQVTQIAPSIEFKISDSVPELKAKSIQLQDPQNQSVELRLKLIPTLRVGASAANGTTARAQEAGQRIEQLPRGAVLPTAGDGKSAPSDTAARTREVGQRIEQLPKGPMLPTVRNGGSAVAAEKQQGIAMDINSLIKPQALAANRLAENPLNLKVGQQLDVKLIGADAQAVKNALTLTLGNKNITVQSNQPVTISPGQDLKIQVTQVAPSVEFKILDSVPGLKAQAIQLQDPKNQSAELRLKLIPTAGEAGSAAVAEKQDSSAPSSPPKQPLDAKILGITTTKIQLQISNPSTAEPGSKQAVTITIDRAQLSNAPANLKVGQSLNLEIVKTGSAPEFKVIPAAVKISEAKVAEFVKQFLPRHEAAPIFLNQLMKDLPKLMENESVPQALKDIAAKIIRNLPPKEQLITSQGLKQSIVNSGLFLEAKLPPAMAQDQLIKELPQLIKNESVPQSLQRIAAEILQNLTTQKQPLPGSPGLEQQFAGLKLMPEAELPLAPSAVKPPDDGMSTKEVDKPAITAKAGVLVEVTDVDAAGKNAMQGASAEDFKANLLKFIHALKQELAPQGEQQLNQTDLDLLKNLQNKTENTVAKLVLDQLMSLPKDDTPKQQWIIDIPFIDRQQAESVKIEIQRDKENKQQSGNSDWSVNITITPPELGTIHCMLSYRNAAINAFFKSQNTHTTELIKHNLDYLKNQLEASGLTTGHMDAHDGVQKTQAPHQLAGKKLFDDKA